jgi:hypothetical protein
LGSGTTDEEDCPESHCVAGTVVMLASELKNVSIYYIFLLGLGLGCVVPSSSSLDRAFIFIRHRLNNEPKQHISHTHNQNGAVEIENVTEHELP